MCWGRDIHRYVSVVSDLASECRDCPFTVLFKGSIERDDVGAARGQHARAGI